MKTKFNGILTLLLALVVQISFAQEKTVSGTVTDDSGGLPGVSVLIKGTTQGTDTDFDGKYSIKTKVGDVLVFSYVGYESVERTVGSANVINVTMKAGNVLDEVIVVAYGTATKESLTGAVQVVGAKDLANRNVTSPIAALEGKVTGVQFTSGSGRPGAGPGIVIRGVGTLNGATAPLIIVDGVQYQGALSTINQEDIASFTVLKDAASTSLYGSRAANGVIIITTKSGTKGAIKVTASTSSGVVSRGVKLYEATSPGQYYEAMWQALKNSAAGQAATDPAAFASANIYSQLSYNPFNVANDQIVGTNGQLNPNASVIYNSLDWYDTLERVGLRNNYNVNVAAGGENHKVFFSASYLDEESYVIKSSFERLTTRVNADFDVNDNIKIGGSANVTITEVAGPTSAGTGSIVNPFGFAKSMGSIYPVFVNDLQGNIVLDEFGQPLFDNGEGFSQYNIGTRPTGQGRHALQELLLNDERDQQNTYGFRFYGEVKILDGLNFRLTYGRDINDLISKDYENGVIGDAQGSAVQPGGRFDETRFRRSNENFTQIFTYNKTFNDVHNIGITAGHESFRRTETRIRGFKNVQATTGIFELDNFSNILSVTGRTDTKRIEGYLARANYNYDNKYFISASFRRDGSSTFSSDYRWGNFYSVGGSWSIDKESFMENVDFVNSLKLRGSYGQVGNDFDTTNDYLYQAIFSITSAAADPAFLLTDLGNEFIQWETIENWDVALEFSLFDNFLDGSIEYYKRNSSDLINLEPIAPSNGINIQQDNVGDMFNSGWELGLTAHLFNTSDFKWDLTLQASTLKNEITFLNTPFISGSKRWEIGRSRFDFYLLPYAGVDPANGDALFFLYELDADGNSVPVLDANGNTQVTNNWQDTERIYTGDSSVPDLLGSISNSFSYKGFTLDVLVNYGIGGAVIDNGYSAMMHTGAYGNSFHPDILNAWKQPGDITSVPRLENGATDLVLTQSDRFITDASFWSLRNVNLGYSFDSDLLDKIGLDALRINFTGENLYLKSKRKGLNPQAGLAGTSSGNGFNPSRIYSLGLNLSF